jgi:hypothetical protein
MTRLQRTTAILTCVLALTACRVTPGQRHALARAVTAAMLDNIFDVETRATRSRRATSAAAAVNTVKPGARPAVNVCRLQRIDRPSASPAPSLRRIELSASRLDAALDAPAGPETQRQAAVTITAELDKAQAAMETRKLRLDSGSTAPSAARVQVRIRAAIPDEVRDTAGREALVRCAKDTAQVQSAFIIQREVARIKAQRDCPQRRIVINVRDLVDGIAVEGAVNPISVVVAPAL